MVPICLRFYVRQQFVEINETAVSKILKKVRFPGRFETYSFLVTNLFCAC